MAADEGLDIRHSECKDSSERKREKMAFMNPMMQQMGGGFPGGGAPGGGGLMGQFARGSMDGSLVGKEKFIAGRALMDEKMTEMAAKMDGVVTPQERMAIMAKKMKASGIMNSLRTNGMGNVSREALMRQKKQQMQQMQGHGMHGHHHHHHGMGPGGFGGPGQFAWGGGQGASAQAVGGVGNVSMSAAFSTGGGTARAVAGPQGAFASAGF